jgi:hypothetical protein
MPPEPLLVTTHIHTDGPVPGPHSLLTLTSAAQPRAGGPISTFGMNVRELPGATLHPSALRRWQRRPEDWLASRRASRPPAVVANAYLRWVERLPGEPVFVTDTTRPDSLFLYWYCMRFAGRWPFATVIVDADLRCQLSEPFCSLKGCRTVAA